MSKFYVWWASQPNEVKAAIVGAVAAALISVTIGVSAWLLFGIPKAIAWYYKRVLLDLEDTEHLLKQESKPNTTSPNLK